MCVKVCVSHFVNNAAENMRVQISFMLVFSFSLGKYPEVEFLDHMVVYFEFFKEPLYCSP